MGLALLAALAGTACTRFETGGPDAPAVALAEATPAILSDYVPTFELRVDEAAFADMLARFDEDVEVPLDVSMWRDGERVLAPRPAEVQVKGNFSATFALKPLGIKLDDAVDNPAGRLFRVPALLPGQRLDRLKSLRLRNGGNDFTGTLLKDLAYGRVVAASGLDVVAVYGEPAAAFVNGDFYGLLNLRSEGNGHGVSRLLGVDKDRLALAELDEAPQFDVKDGDPERFRALERAIRAGDVAYLRDAIDASSFIDFAIVGTVFAAWDWPWKNVRLFSVDGAPFRFVVYDFDLACERHLDEPPVHHLRDREENLISRAFEVLYADAGFRERLHARYLEVLDADLLHPGRLESAFRELAATYEPVIALQTQRYGFPEGRGVWYLKLQEYLEAYQRRYDYLQAARSWE